MVTTIMDYFKKPVSLKDKKTMAAIIGALLLLIALPLTVIGTLQLKEGTQHLKTRAAVPPIESMPFPRILNFRYLMDPSFDGANDDEIKDKIAGSDFGKFAGMIVDGGMAKNIHKSLIFKRYNSDKLVLLYFWSTSRNKKLGLAAPQHYDFGPKINETWPGYWLLMNCATLDSEINNTDDTTTVGVTRCDKATKDLPFTANAPVWPYTSDDAMIWEPDPDGGGPFGKNPTVEYVHLTGVNDGTKKITFKRAAWGEGATKKTFSKGAKIATIADTGGGAGNGWGYNLSTMALKNPNDETQAKDWLAGWLVDNFPRETIDGETVELDGYQFDSANWFPPVALRNGDIKNLDCNDDGGIDYCEDNLGQLNTQINSYGVGFHQVFNLVRMGLPDKLITGDDGNRAVSDGNGSEFENFPSGDNYNESSSALADLEFFMSDSFRQPRISYTFTKDETEEYVGGLTCHPDKSNCCDNASPPNCENLRGTDRKNRFGLVASLLYGAFHTYIADYPVWRYYEWDEDGLINTDATGLSPGYLGQIKGTAPQRITRFTLGNMISNSSLDNLTDWRVLVSSGYEGTENPDNADKVEGAGSAKVIVSKLRGDGEPAKQGVRFRYVGPTASPGLNIEASSEYTASFWAKSNAVREILVTLRNATGADPLSDEEQIKIDSTWRKYYLNFEINTPDPNAVLQFSLGREIGEYWFDDVQFHKGTAEILTREFDNGLAVLNGSSVARTFTPADLGGLYKKINGVQDHDVNDDKLITDTEPLVLGRKDGIVLLKVSSPPKIGDIEPIGGDGDVDIYDLSTLITSWGATSGPADINNDETVDIFDLSTLLSHWGT